jgi:hypothetical protein
MRLDVSDDITLASPRVFLLYALADNPNYYNLEGTEPAVEMWLTSLVLTSNSTVKVEVGLCLADRTGFVPYYTAFLANGSHFQRDDRIGDQPKLDMSHATINKLAIRVSVPANATGVKVAGEVNVATV